MEIVDDIKLYLPQYLIFPSTDIREVPVILLSNTCDMSNDNKRMYESRVMYAPILNLEKFEISLREKFDNQRVDNLIKSIKAQHISQILYLPKGGSMQYEGIVFFDRTISAPLNKELVCQMCANRMFSLSNFGFYLFLLKLSIHFTRVQEKIDRTTAQNL